jgi:hypothetical protein
MPEENLNDKQPTPLADNDGTPVNDADTSKGIGDQKPTDNNLPVPKEFNVQQSYEELQSKFDNLNKSYGEIRKSFTQRSQESAALQKKLDEVYDTLRKATETPIDPAQFIRDLQTQGPKALQPHFQKWLEPIKVDYEGRLSEANSKNLALETEVNLMRRRSDATNYPDFIKLEPVMKELSDDPNCPVNWNMSIADCIDTLYKLAKDRSAEQAVEEARKLGKDSADSKLAREAKAGTAGGGKSVSTSTPDLNKITDIDELRKVVAAQIGVAERD